MLQGYVGFPLETILGQIAVLVEDVMPVEALGELSWICFALFFPIPGRIHGTNWVNICGHEWLILRGN